MRKVTAVPAERGKLRSHPQPADAGADELDAPAKMELEEQNPLIAQARAVNLPAVNADFPQVGIQETGWQYARVSCHKLLTRLFEEIDSLPGNRWAVFSCKSMRQIPDSAAWARDLPPPIRLLSGVLESEFR